MNSSSTRQKFFFALLYFCEGAPIGFIWWNLPTQLRIADVPIEKITLLTSLLVLPWAFKFLWAPIVDTIQHQRWNLKSWIISAQIIMIATLLPLLFLNFQTDFSIIFILLILHTLSAATQDVAIDALCISTIKENELGSVNGWMQFGMLIGRSLFGGISLILVAHIGYNTMLIAMMLVIGIITAIVFFSSIEIPERLTQKKFSETFQSLRKIFSFRSTWFGFAFAVFGGIAYEGVGIVAGPFFVDRGISAQQIGFFFSFLSVGGMLIGALVGGYASDKFGKHTTVKFMTVAISLSVLLVAIIDSVILHDKIIPLFFGMTVMYFTIGLFTSSTYALFMEVTDRNLGATQFSAFMGGTNLCESLASFAAGNLIAAFDYPIAFSVLAFVSLLSVPLINKIQSNTQ